MNILINWIILSLAVGLTGWLLPGVVVQNAWAAVIAALVIGIINALIRPLLLALTLPVNVLTLGLFTFVINALLILLAASIVDGFSVDNFWWALLFSLIVSIVASILESMVKQVRTS